MKPDQSFSVLLAFAEDLPKSPGTMRLWRIMFKQFDLKTDADVSSFFSAVVEKYGPATFATTREIIYCAETGPGKTCRVSPSYDMKTLGVELNCCSFAPQLGRVGFYARRRIGYVGPPVIEIDLYDAAFASQSAKEEARMIGETRTTGKPVL